MARGPAKKKARAVQHANTRIMNVFSLFADARQAARWHADAHMKLALEAAQIASTVYWHYGQTPPYPDPYRPTHAHHPCVRWACQGFDQFYHVVAYGLALTLQFRRRFRSDLWLKRVQAAKPLHALCRAGAPRARVLEAYRRAVRACRAGDAAHTGKGDHKCRAPLLAMLARPPDFAAGPPPPGMGGAFMAACGPLLQVPLAFRDDSRLFTSDGVASYRAYYALKYLRKPRCRRLHGSRRHGLLACVAMALSSRVFRIPPRPPAAAAAAPATRRKKRKRKHV